VGKGKNGVDFGVAVGEVQGEKKQGRGRPIKLPWEKKPARGAARSPAKKKPAAGKLSGKDKAGLSITNNYLENNNVNICSEEFKELIKNDNPDFNSARALGEQLTVKELKFLEIYLSGEGDRIQSMKLAGYDGLSDSMLYLISRKIVEKYEAGGGVGPKVLRAVGLGELKIAKLLKSIAETAKSDLVRLEALKFAANCLGMSKPDETFQGFSIVFNPPAGGSAADKPVEAAPAVPVQVKALQITR